MALWFTLLVALGATNREMTAVLLVMAWFALRPRDWRWGLLHAGVGAATYVGIRLLIGDSPNNYTFTDVLRANLEAVRLRDTIFYNLMLLPLWLLCLTHWRQTPAQLRQLTITVLTVYLLLWAGLAVWREVRLLMPVAILLLPLIRSRRSLG